MNPTEWLERMVRAALAEDVGEGDWTTAWTIPADARTRAVVVAKQRMVVAGLGAAGLVFSRVDRSVAVREACADGDELAPDGVVLRLEGPTRAILTAERIALNFLGRLSGVATLTRRFVEAVRGTGARIVDTRKTTPGWRALEKAAVRAGGGVNHRMGLYDMVLIKDNHIDAAGGVVEAVEAVRTHNRRGLPVEVEVRTLEELEAVLPLGVDRVLLDNMAPDMLRRAVALARGARPADRAAPLLEASGNVTLSTVREIAEAGVDLISVGALTHSAPSADVSLRVEGRGA